MKHTALTYKALLFAKNAHEAVGQKRKYTGDDYIVHPIAVAELVATVTDNQYMIAAALLHDTVEDTKVTEQDIRDRFGDRVADLVMHLTDVSKLSDGNRKDRKELDLQHTAAASKEAKTVKLADLIDNSRSIAKYDSHFAKTYMVEKRRILAVLQEGDKTLLKMAEGIVEDYFATV